MKLVMKSKMARISVCNVNKYALRLISSGEIEAEGWRIIISIASNAEQTSEIYHNGEI
jgi:hypothetical protein